MKGMKEMKTMKKIKNERMKRLKGMSYWVAYLSILGFGNNEDWVVFFFDSGG